MGLRQQDGGVHGGVGVWHIKIINGQLSLSFLAYSSKIWWLHIWCSISEGNITVFIHEDIFTTKAGKIFTSGKKIHQNLRIQWIQSEHSSGSCHTILSQVTDSTRINCQHSLRVKLKFCIVIILSYSEDLSFVFGNFSTMISGKKILSQDKIRNYLCSYGACN